MFINYLLNIATQGNTDYTNTKVRGKIGYIAGIAGLIINVLLTAIKVIIGLSISSIAVTADAFNNLSDATSSIITIIGLNISNAPPDKEHPHGHGRVEYLTALMVAFMVMVVGVQFVKSSANRIVNPEPVKFQWISLILLLISIVLKVWLVILNRRLGDKISSTALKATATDALGDVLTTSVIILSLLLSFVTDFPIDGYVGLLVSILILYSGFSLVKETISPLIGEAPDPDLISAINQGVLSYDYIIGVHDLIVHNYGPGKTMATIDVEVPADIDLVTIHDIVDQAERELSEKYDLHLVIHIDPVGHESKEVKEVKREVKHKIKDNKLIESMHDFNIVEEDGNKCVIFHIVIDGNKIDKGFSEEKLKDEMVEAISGINPNMSCNIVVDIEYEIDNKGENNGRYDK